MPTATDPNTCIIWPSFPATRATVSGRPSWKRVEFSDRAGTNYLVSRDAELNLGDPRWSDQERARLTTRLINANLQGIREPEVTLDAIKRAKDARPLRVRERADRLLRHLVDSTSSLGMQFRFGGTNYTTDSTETPITNTSMAWSESEHSGELKLLLDYLQKSEWIAISELGTGQSGYYDIVVTVQGHTRVAEMLSRTESPQAFVAMWLDDSMYAVYNEAIAPAIEAAGYRPYRIDRDLGYTNTIDDKIISEIRRSRFLVADFTHAKSETVRGSVYFEAGLALGLGIPLIFTARKSSDLHFDTSHFLHIFWSEDDLPKLKQDLTDRILAIPELGAGPLMGNP